MKSKIKSILEDTLKTIDGGPWCLCALVAKKILQPRLQGATNHEVIVTKPVILIFKWSFLTFRLWHVISALFIIIPNISAISQPDSLFHYMEISAKNNPGVLQKFSEYQAALQKIPQVGSLPDPELSAGVFLSPMELVSGNQVADLRLMQMFPWFGVLKNAKDEMSLMANAKFELFRDAKLQVCYDVQRTWNELYKVQNEITISEKNIEILKTIELLSITKYKATSFGNTEISASVKETSKQSGSMGSDVGKSTLSDIYRIQIEEGDLENNIALLKGQHKTISAQFNSYLNRPALSNVFTPQYMTQDSLGLTLTSVSDSILSNNTMLNMLKYEKLSIEARKKMISRMGYPMMGAGINYSLINKNEMSTSSMNGKDMIMPMVTITLPVYRKKYKAMRAEAGFMESATSQNLESVSNSLQNEYYQAVQLYQDAQRRIILYNNQYNLATKSLDLMLKKFSVSSSELTDVLRVRQQTLEYEFKQVEAVTDFNTAVAWLRRLGNFEINVNK